MTNQEEKFEEMAHGHNLAACEELRNIAAVNDSESQVADEFDARILSVDKTEVYDVCMGTGGPAYGYRIYVTVSPDGEEKSVSHATSYFQDWGTPKQEMRLSDEEQAALLSLVYIDGVSE